jgi:hypothetical protein
VRHSLQSAIGEVFFLGMIISVAGFVVVLFLKEVRLRRSLSEALETREGIAEAADGNPVMGEVGDSGPEAAASPAGAGLRRSN